MMNETQFVEAAGIPTQHIRFDFVDRVPPWSPPQTVNRFPTGPSIDLGCASHMEFRGGLKGLNSVDVVINISATNPQLGFILEMFKTPFKIIPRQAQISVELHNEIPVTALEGLIAVIERFHYSPTRLSETSVHPMNDADPWQLRCVAIDDFTRTVRGAIVNDYPLRRLHSLSLYGSDSRLDKLLFVAYRCNDYVSRHWVNW